MEKYIEIPFANQFKVIISNVDGEVLASLENPNGYVVSDRAIEKEWLDHLKEVVG
jgi:hypothetical protein